MFNSSCKLSLKTFVACNHLCSSFGESSRVIDPGYSRQSGCIGEVQYRRIKLNGFSALDRYYLDCSVTAGIRANCTGGDYLSA